MSENENPWLTKPYRVVWSEPENGTAFKVYFRKFATEEEATHQMKRMAASMTWDGCDLFVIQERNIRIKGGKDAAICEETRHT
jgi:hypothetical protein